MGQRPAPSSREIARAASVTAAATPLAELLPRGPAKGVAAAVTEAARAISRELGAGRWPI